MKDTPTQKERSNRMDFEKAYQKFLNGTASPEEVEFVRSEMKKANDINDILTSVKKEGATETAERATVKKAMRTYLRKDILKTVAIVCCAVFVLAIGIGCAIGIPILSNAKDNMHYTVADAERIAVEYLADRYPEGADKIAVRHVERELEVEGRIKNARYIYVLDVYNGKDSVLEIEIDSKTGNIIEVD
jgi:hypothetical protein